MTEELPLELLSPDSWVDHGKSGSVKKRRRAVLKYWVTANSFPSVTEGIKTVQGNGHLYGSFDATMGLLEKEGMSPATLHQYRNIYKDFINSCISDLDEKAYERIVRKEENTGSITEKYTPVVDEVKEILLHANTRGKAIVSLIADTGMRINEALSRKRSDIEFDYQPFPDVVVPARIRIEAGATKKKYTRYCYLSHEAVKLLKDFWKETRQSEWAFPSEWCKSRDTHLLDSNLRKEFHALFDRLGLTPRQADMTFSPHSFRSFCLGIMRRSGFSDVQGKIIVGHRDLETKSYKGNERDIAKNWVEIVEPRLNFLSEKIEVIKKDPEQDKKIRQLEAKSEKTESQNKAILDALGYLLTPEQRKKLNLKLPYYSDAQIEKIIEGADDQEALPEQKAIEDQSEKEGVQA